MRKSNFLDKLKKEEKIQAVEPSIDICTSYLEKSSNCLKSAKLLLNNELYENSIGMSYYAMYNALLALLFRIGIKCENHSGSILLLKLLFDEHSMFNSISFAKRERIDKQYYVTAEKDETSKEAAKELYANSEEFVLEIRVVINNLDNSAISNFRKKFANLVGAKKPKTL